MGRLGGFQQGQFDSLCGLYSITNAVSVVAKPHRFTQAKSQALLHHLFADLNSRSKLLSVLQEGAYPHEISKLLSVTQGWLFEQHNIKLNRFKPFHKKKDVSLPDIFDTVLTHIAQTNGVAIIGFEGRIDHWTVVEGMTEKRLMLRDSDGRRHIERKHCRLACDPIDEHFYMIAPAHVFLLSLLP
ncbi:MAG: hypothetical protein HWE34_02060 [Methylocystaceae bacterium]|nr:hypothetical protein [Methylocystaceae bacterium]